MQQLRFALRAAVRYAIEFKVRAVALLRRMICNNCGIVLGALTRADSISDTVLRQADPSAARIHLQKASSREIGTVLASKQHNSRHQQANINSSVQQGRGGEQYGRKRHRAGKSNDRANTPVLHTSGLRSPSKSQSDLVYYQNLLCSRLADGHGLYSKARAHIQTHETLGTSGIHPL